MRHEIMKPIMPPPDIYEQEYLFWPWGSLLDEVTNYVVNNAPVKGVILDYMCGTGFLLNRIGLQRPDLVVGGCTLEPKSYVEYANKKYPEANVVFKDAFDFRPFTRPDIITCTAGIHHLSRNLQANFIQKTAKELQKKGLFLIGEEVIRDYSGEVERRLSTLELFEALTEIAINKNAPDEVIKAAIDMFSNDIFENGEYKCSLIQLQELISPYFEVIHTKWIWPAQDSPNFGDIFLVCKKKGNVN